MAMSATASSPRFRAFISYSHQDQLWAQWLHKTLESYRVPRKLIGQTTAAGVIPERLAPIFRDRDELPSATDLNRKVNEALGQSANLIVVCSPRSATSRWVNEEVLAFKRLGRADRIFCLIVEGEPNATDLPGRAAEECFGSALRFEIGPDGQPTQQRTEPIAADARAGKDGKANAKLKLIAGMLDVGFDTLKQRELHRRNRRMAAITALALIVMAITTTLAITAVIARNDAERRQKQAEDLVGFMLGDLNDKLREVGRLDILEAVGDKAMAYFKSLPNSDVTEEALSQRAKALEEIGSVRMDQGHLGTARESFQAALELSRSLAEGASGDATRQVAYSRLWTFLGMADWYEDNLESAQLNFERARDVLQNAQARPAHDPDLIFQLTSIDNNIGHVLEAQGKLDEAAVQYEIMLKHCKELISPGNAKVIWESQVGTAHNNLGKSALMRGDLVTAVAEYAADDAIEARLSARDPKNNDQLGSMFTARAILGRTLALTGDVESALRHTQEAVDIATKLRAHDPTATDVQENLALYQMQLSRLLRLTGRLSEAKPLTTESLETFATLTKQASANAGWQREYAEVQAEQAAQSLAADKVDQARKQAKAALETLDAAFSKKPDDRAVLLATANARLLLASMTRDAATAQQLRESVLSAIANVKSGAADPRMLGLQVDALLQLDRKTEAEPVIQKLWASGYRDPAFLALLQREQIDYSVNASFRQRLETAIAQNGR
jgi:tetratricopeptide (TPR) repeat protein